MRALWRVQIILCRDFSLKKIVLLIKLFFVLMWIVKPFFVNPE